MAPCHDSTIAYAYPICYMAFCNSLRASSERKPTLSALSRFPPTDTGVLKPSEV